MKNVSNVEFLSDNRILKAVQELCKPKPSLIQIAVSYWGQDALSSTGLSKRIENDVELIKVICDLDSPGCNPEPIQELISAGVAVKTLRNFHAKVWICGDCVIVGSANVSLYGLGFNDANTSLRKVEAAVSIQDKHFVALVQDWFNNWWQSSVNVTPNHLKVAQEKWAERRDALKNLPWSTRLTKDERDERRKAFFQALLRDLNKHGYRVGQNLTAKAASRLEFGAGKRRVFYFARFAKSNEVCVELNITTDDEQWNKQKFDQIHRQQRFIEKQLDIKPGETLRWERHDGKQKSSIEISRVGKISDEDAVLNEIRRWMVKQLFAFNDVFHRFIE